MKIITNFTIATEQGTSAILKLTEQIAMEKFAKILDSTTLLSYIEENFSKKNLVAELNSMSNQYLIVYVDDEPAGYARITSRGQKPIVLSEKRAIRIADFGVLIKYSDQQVYDSLFKKCLTVCKPYEGIWINEYIQNPLIEFFESRGFVSQPEVCEMDELPLQSVFLITE